MRIFDRFHLLLPHTAPGSAWDRRPLGRLRICSLPACRSTNSHAVCPASYDWTADQAARYAWTLDSHIRADTGIWGGADSVGSGEVGEIAVTRYSMPYAALALQGY